VHAHEVLRRLARQGLDVTLRTSAVAGGPARTTRDGYRVDRRHGRYAVFPAAAAELAAVRPSASTGIIEIWNGMPFLTPLWAPRVPRVVLLHHVHAEMWRMVLSRWLGPVGETFERRVAPLVYHRARVLTLTPSSAAEIVSMLGLPAHRVSVVPCGVDWRFTPGGPRARDPLVLAVGRLVPVKRFELLVDTLVELRRAHPRVQGVVVGEGYERARLEEHIRRRGAGEFVSLPGRVPDDELVALYRRAWVVASTSAREGWGMTLTEAAACGTPAVASRIAGHVDTVEHGRTGFLAEPGADFAARLDAILSDPALRDRMGAAAAARSGTYRWSTTADGVLSALAEEAVQLRTRRRS
jgi:glycosyltransferase involved in cell wall biosynthesis